MWSGEGFLLVVTVTVSKTSWRNNCEGLSQYAAQQGCFWSSDYETSQTWSCKGQEGFARAGGRRKGWGWGMDGSIEDWLRDTLGREPVIPDFLHEPLQLGAAISLPATCLPAEMAGESTIPQHLQQMQKGVHCSCQVQEIYIRDMCILIPLLTNYEALFQ